MSEPVHRSIEQVTSDLQGELGQLQQGVLTSYDRANFFNRLSHMVALTHEYSATLPITWQDAQAGALEERPAKSSAVDETGLTYQQEIEISQLVRKIKNAGITEAVLEAAHVYFYEDLDDPKVRDGVVTQTRHAAVLASALHEAGVSTRQILFIDDYNSDPEAERDGNTLDIDYLLVLAQESGYSPGMILREAGMVQLAQEMIRVMDERQGLVTHVEINDIDRSDSRQADLYLTRRNLELYRAGDDMVSCAMLDAALTMLKWNYLGQAVVNILPRRPGSQEFSYRGQQRKLRTILGEHLDARVLPLFNIFTGTQQAEPIAAGSHHAFRKKAKQT